MTFADQVIQFHLHLHPPGKLPGGVTTLNPYHEPEGQRVFKAFFLKYYHDLTLRHYLFGINPGRFGAGITGISFTDPIRLSQVCGISNEFQPRPELSSEFIYRVVDTMGGPAEFFRNFYLTAVSPLGFVKNHLNINYYDDKKLSHIIEPFAIRCIQTQVAFGCHRDIGICIGQGQNFMFFQKLNEQFGWFNKILALPHPRWVMQYRRKQLSRYVDEYVHTLSALIHQE